MTNYTHFFVSIELYLFDHVFYIYIFIIIYIFILFLFIFLYVFLSFPFIRSSLLDVGLRFEDAALRVEELVEACHARRPRGPAPQPAHGAGGKEKGTSAAHGHGQKGKT